MEEKPFATRMEALLGRHRERPPYGTTPGALAFIDAAFQGDIPRLRELVSDKHAYEKARLADMIFGGLGALQVAARLGRLDVVTYFVEELGFDVDGSSGELELTALCCAALDGKLETVEYLLNHGANPNKKNKHGQVPLHCAARYGHDEVAELILSKGATIDMTYSDGSPLHIASFYGKTNVMKVLLEHNANRNLVSYLGTPLVATLYATADQVLQESISLECIDLLVKAGADVNFTDGDIDTPLEISAMYGLNDCTKYLLKAGADADIPHACCIATPIEIAASFGVQKHVQTLLPYTSPIQTVADWTVKGIISHVRSKDSKLPKHTPAAGLKRRLNSNFNFVRITDLPEPDIVITVEENDPDPFRYIEQELRDLLAKHNNKGDLLDDLLDSDDLKALGSHPLLEGQTNSDPPTTWIHAKLQLSGSPHWVVLVVRKDNVYVMGFANERNGEEFCYEMTAPAIHGVIDGYRPQILPFIYLPIPLHWDVTYNALLNCQSQDVEARLRAMDEDPNFVSDTIRYLSSYDLTIGDDSEAMARLAGLIFKFSEYTRMNLRGRSRPFLDKVQRWTDICVKLRAWRDKGYKDWDKFGRLKAIGINSERDALEWVCLVLNRAQQFLDEMKRSEDKNPRSEDREKRNNAPSESDRNVQGGDGIEPPRKDGKSAQGDERPKENNKSVPFGRRRVQLLTVIANFPVAAVNIYDSHGGQSVCTSPSNHKEVGKNLVLTGPRRPLGAFGVLGVEAFPDATLPGYPLIGEWYPNGSDGDDDDDEKPRICVQRIGGAFGRMIEVTYLLIPNAIEAKVNVKLVHQFSSWCWISGTIKAFPGGDFGGHHVSLFASEENFDWDPFQPVGYSSDTFPPSCFCLPYRPDIEIEIEVDLTLHCDLHAFKIKSNMKFTPGITTFSTEELAISVTMHPNLTSGGSRKSK